MDEVDDPKNYDLGGNKVVSFLLESPGSDALSFPYLSSISYRRFYARLSLHQP